MVGLTSANVRMPHPLTSDRIDFNPNDHIAYRLSTFSLAHFAPLKTALVLRYPRHGRASKPSRFRAFRLPIQLEIEPLASRKSSKSSSFEPSNDSQNLLQSFDFEICSDGTAAILPDKFP